MKHSRRNRTTALVLAALALVTAVVLKLPDWYEAWKTSSRIVGQVEQLDESLLRTANTQQILTLLEDPGTEWVDLSAQTDIQAVRDAGWAALTDWQRTEASRREMLGYNETDEISLNEPLYGLESSGLETLYELQNDGVPVSPLELLLALPGDAVKLQNLRPLDTGWKLVSLRGSTESGAASAMLWSVTFQGYGTFDEVQVLFDPQTSVIYRVSGHFGEWYIVEQEIAQADLTEKTMENLPENELASTVGVCYWGDKLYVELTMRESDNAVWLDFNGPAGGDALMG